MALLLNAKFVLGSSSNEATPLETLDVMDSLDQMEAKVQRLSIHEEMLKEVKVSKLALELADSDGPHEYVSRAQYAQFVLSCFICKHLL